MNKCADLYGLGCKELRVKAKAAPAAAAKPALSKDTQKVCDLTQSDAVQKEEEAKAETIADLEKEIEKYTAKGSAVIVKELKVQLADAKKDTTSKDMNQAAKCLVGDRQRTQNAYEQKIRPMEEQLNKNEGRKRKPRRKLWNSVGNRAR